MTVSNQTCRITPVAGSNAEGQEVPFEFPIAATSDLVVKTRVTATGVESDPLTLTTDYTVEIDGDSGGTVTMVAAIPETTEIHVIRDTPMTQALDLTAGGDFSAEDIEDAVDKNTKLAIENSDAISRAIRIPATDSSSLDPELPNSVDRANKYIYFDADGNPIAVAAVEPTDVGEVTISAWSKTHLDDGSEAAFKATVNLEPGVDVQAYDADLTAIGALAKTDGNFIVGNGTTWVAESGATARASMAAVCTSGNETIAGIKTFSSSPVVPTPTTDYQAATKLYVDDSAAKIAGDVVQVVYSQTGAVATGTTLIPWDDTIPQYTEGTQFLSRVITPTSATNILRIDVIAQVSNSASTSVTMALFQDAGAGSPNALAATTNYCYTAAGLPYFLTLTYYMVAGTANATTFSVRIGGHATSTITLNGSAAARKLGGVALSGISITEIQV